MSDELNEELDEGKRLATLLTAHLLAMGASECSIPIFVADEKYEVTVSHVPVTPV